MRVNDHSPLPIDPGQLPDDGQTGTRAPLAAEGVTVNRGGVRVLDQVSFTAGPGCLMGVVGPNGAGKSTLFNVIVGLLPVDQGRVLVHGRPIEDSRGLVAYVPQQESVNWRVPMSVWDVVMQGRTRRSGGSADRATWTVGRSAKRSHRWECSSVALPWSASSPVDSGSGSSSPGRSHRARDILLLDEAFSGVDVASQEALVSVLHDLRTRGGRSCCPRTT